MYKHGISISEKDTQMKSSVVSDSAIQVVVGSAPTNLINENKVNVPVLLNNFEEAKTKIGYTNDIKNFSICEAVKMAFDVYKVSPIVVINVLDKTKHIQAVVASEYNINNKEILIEETGVLLDSIIVKNGETTYEMGNDYVAEFTEEGNIRITIDDESDIAINNVTSLNVGYTKIDPSLVTEKDILGGIEKIKDVYPKLNVVPGLLVAPGWSQKASVRSALIKNTERLNGLFNCSTIIDIEASSLDEAIKAKEDCINNEYLSDRKKNKRVISAWPMIKLSGETYHFSTALASLMAYVDSQNDNVPFVSPSNKKMDISGLCLNDDTEVVFDYEEANKLNAAGIVTAINLNGWRAWGNNTSIYPLSEDIKDRFIPVRRMFDWWGNNFILRYFERVDDPLNKKTIESIVDEENIIANGFKSRFQIAEAKIEFLSEDNSNEDLLNGHIKFRQYLTPYPPAEYIENTLEFSTQALAEAINNGGDN